MNNCSYFIYILIALVPFQINGQVSEYDQLSHEYQKLTHRYVHNVVKDNQGFLWVGTSDGLNRFDGEMNIHFKKSFDAPYHISQRTIKTMLIHESGRIIILYSENQTYFDVLTPETFALEQLKLDRFFTHDEKIVDIQQKRDGTITCITSNLGSSQLYNISKDLTPILEFSFTHNGRKSLAYRETENSGWLVLDNGKILELGVQGEIKRSFFAPEHRKEFTEKSSFLNFVDKQPNGQLWFSFEKTPGIYLLRENDLKPLLNEEIGYTDQIFKWIERDLEDNRLMYAGSSFDNTSTLLRKDHKTGEIENISENYISRNEATCAFGENFYSGFYLGTVDGLKLIAFKPTYFKSSFQRQVALGQWGTSVRGIVKTDKGELFVAREIDDWFKMDQNATNGDIDTIPILPGFANRLDKLRCSRELISHANKIYGSVHTPDDTYRFLIYNQLTGQKDSIGVGHHIQTIEKIDEQILIGCGEYGSNGALYIYDLKSSKITQFLQKNGENPFKEYFIQAIIKVGDQIWAGGYGGIFTLNLQENTIEHLSKTNKKLFPNSELVITDFLLHSDGRLFVGYIDYGVDIINFATNSKINYSVRDGLAQEHVAQIVEDNNSDVWISTFNGLSKFENKTNEFTNFHEEDGISHNEFNRFSSYKDNDGKIYFGGLNGVVSFFPEDIVPISNKPNILLKYLRYFNSNGEEKQYIGSFKSPIGLNIPAEFRTVNIGFSLDNYFDNNGNHFEYQIKDTLSDSWNILEQRNELALDFLPAGNYPIFIRGKDRSGNISENYLQIKLNVLQYFYESIWFYLGLAILAGLIAFMFFRSRFQQHLKLIEVRQDISRDLHDEVGSLLTGMAMKSDLLSRRVDELVKPDVVKLSKMGRDAVRQMRDIVWSIDNKKNTIGDLTDRIHEFTSEVLNDSNINYQLDVINFAPSSVLSEGIRKNVYLIIREAVNNVLKHSNANKCIIKLEKERNNFKVEIKDNGHVDETKIKKSGLGLLNLKERAKSIRAQLKIDHTDGYSINLEIPLNQ